MARLVGPGCRSCARPDSRGAAIDHDQPERTIPAQGQQPISSRQSAVMLDPATVGGRSLRCWTEIRLVTTPDIGRSRSPRNERNPPSWIFAAQATRPVRRRLDSAATRLRGAPRR